MPFSNFKYPLKIRYVSLSLVLRHKIHALDELPPGRAGNCKASDDACNTDGEGASFRDGDHHPFFLSSKPRGVEIFFMRPRIGCLAGISA